ncbi:Uncharacterised protein [Chromobacterium violaceum]|uniref:Uncharacterized protein n=1 Tax=Chromobacterium violaceum TaxID=536 RepID=A0AAX2M870_CHRVL|nr:Uncharacterised protein [Chromobacterium violaceum]SUX32411.1 Uncharacterised protein [Chromobacterium violaceum]
MRKARSLVKNDLNLSSKHVRPPLLELANQMQFTCVN